MSAPRQQRPFRQVGFSVLVDFDGRHHTHLFVVHHMAVHHVDPGVVEEARAERYGAALAFHDHRVAPLGRRQRLAVHFDDLEWIGVDVEHVVVVGVRVLDGPLLDRAQLDPLVDALRIELLVVDEEVEFLPVSGCIRLRRGGR